MGRLDFGRPTAYPAPLVAHALHDDDANVVDGDVAEAIHDGLPAELTAKPEPTLPLGCRWRVPLTWVHNLSSALLLYLDQLDVMTLDIVVSFIFTSTLLMSGVNV